MTEPSLQTLGRYTIRAEIGRGGFATVYRALDTSLNREVALKVLHPQLLTDRSFVERFRKEARTLANLRHPHIVTVYEVSEVEGRLFIAMDLAHGPSLAQAIAVRKRIPWADTLSILKPVSEALDYAHGQNVVHRDLKPANILLDAERGPLLTDFGFARLLGDSSASMSLSGGILGTPAYIAPEVWELDTATATADVYALGCIAYEMLTGEVLFVGKTPMQSMRAHDRGPQFPAAWPEDVPQGVDRVLQAALTRKPESRYPKATTFWHALNDVEANAQVSREQAERQAIADQWKAEAAAAVAASEWSAAKMAVGRWLSITPDDPQAQAARNEIERQMQRDAERKQMQEDAQRLRREAEDKAKRETEERERQQQAELAAQAAVAETAKREAEERERQKQVAQATALEKSKREAAERERQRQATEKPIQRPTAAPPRRETSSTAPTGQSNKMRWVYAAGAIVAVVVIGIMIANTMAPAAPPTAAPMLTEAPVKATEVPAQQTEPPAVEPFQLMTTAAPDCSYGGEFKSMEAVDEKTIKFVLCYPDPALPSKIALSNFGIQSAKHLEETQGSPLDNPLGSGPYMLREWNRGDSIVLEPNPNYWDTDKPKNKTLVFKWNNEAAARLTSLAAGQVNGIDNPDPNDFATIEADSTLKLLPRPALNVFYLGINNTVAPFDDEKVRQAIAMGIDRQAIVDKFYPLGSSVADYFTPCAIPGGCEGDPWYQYDPEKAKVLLAEAGFQPGDIKTTLSYRDVARSYLPDANAEATELQSQLQQIGIEVTPDVQESGTFLDNANKGSLSLHLLGWGVDYPDPSNFLDYHFGKSASAQFGTKFDDLTAALAEAAASSNVVERKTLYAEANNLIKQHVPMVPVAHGGSGVAYQATVEGAHVSPLGNEQMWLMDVPGQDTFVWMQNAEPFSLYCADETDGESLRACEQIFESLLSFKTGTVEVVPGLADLPKANADLTEWTFTLRDGVKFSDGTQLTANDVVMTLAVQWDRANPLHKGNSGNFDYFGRLFGGFLNQ